MAGDGGVARLPGIGCPGSGRDAFFRSSTPTPSTTFLSRPILGMPMRADGVALRAAARWSGGADGRRVAVGVVGVVAASAGELLLQLVLRPRLVEPRAPELVGDEQQDQEPDGDQRLAGAPHHCA